MNFFPQASRSTFYFTNSPLTAVGGNVINNYYPTPNDLGVQEPEDDFTTVRGGDINLLQLVWSGRVEITPPGFDTSKLKPSNPFRVRLEQKKQARVKIMKRVYNAEITGYGERRFTVAMFHPDSGQSGNSEAQDAKWMAWQREFDYWASRRDAYVLQLFGSCRSNFPALIYHNGLVRGSDVFGRYENKPIIFCYLQYQWALSFNNVYTFSREMCRVSRDTKLWWFNPKTDTFQCDPTIIIYSESSQPTAKQKGISNDVYALKVDSASETTVSFDNRPILLDSTGGDRFIATLKIISYLQDVLPNYLWSISDMCWARGTGASGLKSYAPRGLLTFGSVVVKDEDKVHAFFPFVPTPSWIFHDKSSIWPDSVEVERGNSGVTFTFQLDTKGELDLRFSFELPPEHRDGLRTAFLRQSSRFRNANDGLARDPSEFVLVDYIRLRLQTTLSSEGKFQSQPTGRLQLFIPAWKIETVNGLPCVKWPPSESIFAWSFTSDDHQDHVLVPSPEMKIRTYIGTFWFRHHYAAVEEYLELQKRGLEGTRCEEERGYEVLTHGDPHTADG
ncbi:hypothetical protein E1B28_002048 [Marasmius oreades]|uniref:Uncharacterized protein n=1 Tax=Marasmius oreades TaxID=181124 RepID=A0A9P8AGK8_9AGAR|nr:uncharacterized protein E1B28_002048 [Marasmius oreades]KAG7100275.1 hypothetical protein E1B28_002048 [Marasmius oreades]